MAALPYPLGICVSPQNAAALPVEAFDFLEVNVQNFLIPERPEAAFEEQRKEAREAVRPVLSANCFLPGDLKCVGETIDWTRLLAYVETTFRRAQEIGVEIIVFGSGGARTAPEGYSKQQALDDLVAVLKRIAPLAQDRGVTVVLEPLNPAECNIVNTVAEGAEAVERCDHPSVRLLADCYHMLKQNEPASEIVRFGKLIRHVHLAELTGRAHPGRSGEDFTPWFDALRQIDYRGRIALECKWEDVATELPASAAYLQQQAAG